MEPISESLDRDGDPLLEFETELPDIPAALDAASMARVLNPPAGRKELPPTSAAFTIVSSFEPYVPAPQPEPRTRRADARITQPVARTTEPAVRAFQLRARVIEIHSTIAPWIKEGRRWAAVTARRSGSTARHWLLTGWRASYRAAGLLADHLGARGGLIWARVRTTSAPSLSHVRRLATQGNRLRLPGLHDWRRRTGHVSRPSNRDSHTSVGRVPFSVAFPDALREIAKIAVPIASAIRARFRSAWPIATRLGERVSANTLAFRRELPVPFWLTVCVTVGAVMFLLGRLSALPVPAAPLDAPRAAVTSPERGAQ